MADVIAEVDEGFSRTAKDLFSGACGGVAQVLIGMSNLSCSTVLLFASDGNTLTHIIISRAIQIYK